MFVNGYGVDYRGWALQLTQWEIDSVQWARYTSLKRSSLRCWRRRSIFLTATCLPEFFSMAMQTTPVEPSPILTNVSRLTRGSPGLTTICSAARNCSCVSRCCCCCCSCAAAAAAAAATAAVAFPVDFMIDPPDMTSISKPIHQSWGYLPLHLLLLIPCQFPIPIVKDLINPLRPIFLSLSIRLTVSWLMKCFVYWLHWPQSG